MLVEYYQRRFKYIDFKRIRSLSLILGHKLCLSLEVIDERLSLFSPGTLRNNLEIVVSLLDEECEENRIMKAEALRELGRFELAKQILSRVSSRSFTSAIRDLQWLCAIGDSYVRELSFSD